MKAIEYGDLKYKSYYIYHGYGYAGIFDFVHEDYDGAEDAHDNRLGIGESIEDCINQIEEQINETL